MSGRLLLYSSLDEDHRIVSHFLRDSQVQLVWHNEPGAILDTVRQQPFDVVMIDITYQPKESVELASRVRKDSGYDRSMVLLGGQTLVSMPTLNALSAQNMDKPIHAQGLCHALGVILSPGDQDSPGVKSQFSDDPAMAELLSWYRDRAKHVAHHIDQAIQRDDVDGVIVGCRTLTDTSSGYGYDELSDISEQALKEVYASMSIGESMDTLKTLSDMCASLQ